MFTVQHVQDKHSYEGEFVFYRLLISANFRPVELEKKSRKWELIARKGFSSFLDSLVYPYVNTKSLEKYIQGKVVILRQNCHFLTKNRRKWEIISRKWNLIARKGFSSFLDSLVYP
jgi:hypothetical protein